MTLAALILSLLLPHAPASVEIAAWSILRGVDPTLTLAICRVESGHVPERLRDSVRGRDGEYGRLQVMPFHGRRAGCDLRSRSCNLAVGTALIASALRAHGGDWRLASEVYNTGRVGTEKGRAYAARVMREVRRIRPGRVS
jgi:soluble lytic murein transglycosylase-like protein